MVQLQHYDNGVYALESGYGRPLLAAIHLIVEGDRVAIVDTANNAALSRVQEALVQLGLGPGNVDFVVLTHIHLDHAGGAGSFMQAFPKARLVVHPRGARHMAEPSKLWAGVSAVYGEERAREFYGELIPIPAERILEAEEGTVLSLGGRELLCIDLPGHAKHHIGLVDKKGGGIFTGDTFGLSYRELDLKQGDQVKQFVFPTTTPVQFDPEAMHASIDRLLSFNRGDLLSERLDLCGPQPTGIAPVVQCAQLVQALIAEDAEPVADLAAGDSQQLGDLLSGTPLIDPQEGREALEDAAVLSLPSPFTDLSPLLSSQADDLHRPPSLPPLRLRSSRP